MSGRADYEYGTLVMETGKGRGRVGNLSQKRRKKKATFETELRWLDVAIICFVNVENSSISMIYTAVSKCGTALATPHHESYK